MRQELILLCPVLLLFEIVNGQDIRFATNCVTPNQEDALCLELQFCKRLLEQVVLGNTESYEFLRASRCGPNNENTNVPKVCCGSDINFTNAKEIVTRPTMDLPVASVRTTTARASNSDNSILPSDCGDQEIFLEHRIFGGIEADVGEFPWLGRLVHTNRYNRSAFGCSGFLIHRRFILTAAHCLRGEGVQHLGELSGAFFGIHNDTKARICDDNKCSDPPVRVEVLSAIVHSQYDSSSHRHDIALVPLKDEIKFTDFIKAICIPRTATNVRRYIISGWGRTEADANSRTKLKVEIPRADQNECLLKYKSLGLTITNFQICAGGEKGHDSCAGDSGGPLMATGDRNRWYAEGIVSYGNSCGRDGWPGVYTYIPMYYDWIIENIEKALRPNGKFGI